MRLYDDNGYLNIPELLSVGVNFIFIVGGRAIGKTYGPIKEWYTHEKYFALMRRTQAQTDAINVPELSPLTEPLGDLGVEFKSTKLSTGCRQFADKKTGQPICMTCSLSTMANIRGISGRDLKAILFDEFIAQPTERPIRTEAEAFMHAYETLNRNRELNGEEPITVIFSANAFNLANPLFVYLGLVTKAYRLKKSGREYYIDRERGFMIVLPRESEISEKKLDTALYRLAKGTAFNDLALGNDFIYDVEVNNKSLPLREYKIVCTVGEISIYRHKSRDEYYVSPHQSGTPKKVYTTSEYDLTRFRREFSSLIEYFYFGLIYFEEYIQQVLFLKYIY